MKRIMCILLTMMLLLSCSVAEEITWLCPKCGNANTKNFCPVCGERKPKEWICDSCHSLNDGNFCPVCGSPQNGNYIDFTIVFSGYSMADNYVEGDLLAFKTAETEDVDRLDIVASNYPARGDELFVKRLVGFPGDRVKIEDGYLFINDEKYEEPYINDAYRVSGGSNGMSFEEVYIPKKGDALSLEYTDENKNRIVLCVNGEPWVWRGISSAAVAADGDRLTYTKDGTLTLNGEEITADTDRIVSLVGKQFSLEQDLYFVMGDHRNNSNDSRAQGPVSDAMIKGVLVGQWRKGADGIYYEWIEQ